MERRISQFETMVHADPTNDMAHFSLAGAYGLAGRHVESAEQYRRCIQLNPLMSKAYQLAGQAYVAAGRASEAGEILTDGYKVAAERGDRMPMQAMGELLTKLGRAVPEVRSVARSAPSGGGLGGGGDFVCQRTGRPGTKMQRPPFKGPVGQWIFEHISRETFEDWIRQGTKVINELRLDLSRESDEKVYDQHMREYLGLDEETFVGLTKTH